MLKRVFSLSILLSKDFFIWGFQASKFVPTKKHFCPGRNNVHFMTSQQKDQRHDRADVIDLDTNAAKGSLLKVQRYYETFIWKKNKYTNQDHKINYRVEGPEDGPHVLLVHGFGANVNHFRFQFPALVQEGYRVYAVDLLGFGASDKPNDADYSIELFVELLKDFVSSVENQKGWIAAGNSIGGLCCLGLADNLSSSAKTTIIKGVVLFNSAGGMSSFRYELVPFYLRPFLWFVQNVVLTNPNLGGRFFENFKSRENVESILLTQGVYGNTTNVDEELLEILLGPADDEGARDVFLKVFGGEPGPTPQSFLAKMDDSSSNCPVLALWGEADPWTVISMGQTFGKYNRRYRLEALPGAGHCPHDECPELCHEIMLPWMKDIFFENPSKNY